jgi:hypothetical protein
LRLFDLDTRNAHHFAAWGNFVAHLAHEFCGRIADACHAIGSAMLFPLGWRLRVGLWLSLCRYESGVIRIGSKKHSPQMLTAANRAAMHIGFFT